MFVHFKLKETLILLAPVPEPNYVRKIHVNVCQDKITPPCVAIARVRVPTNYKNAPR